MAMEAKSRKTRRNSLVENEDHSSDESDSDESSRDQEYGHGAIMSRETTKKEKKEIMFCQGYCTKRKNYASDKIIVQKDCSKSDLIRLIEKYFRDSEYSLVIDQTRTGEWNLVFDKNESICQQWGDLWCEVLRKQRRDQVRPDLTKFLKTFEEQDETNSYHSMEEYEKSNSESDMSKLNIQKYNWTKENFSETKNKNE